MHPQSPSNIPKAVRRSVEAQARYEVMMHELFEKHIQFNGMLGLEVASLAPEGPQLTFAMRHELVGNFAHYRLHGGVISAVLDTVGGLAVAVALAEKHPGDSFEEIAQRFNRVGTIDLRVDYLRPGQGKRFVATGRVLRLGGRIASLQMTLENDAGALVATGAGSYVVS